VATNWDHLRLESYSVVGVTACQCVETSRTCPMYGDSEVSVLENMILDAPCISFQSFAQPTVISTNIRLISFQSSHIVPIIMNWLVKLRPFIGHWSPRLTFLRSDTRAAGPQVSGTSFKFESNGDVGVHGSRSVAISNWISAWREVVHEALLLAYNPYCSPPSIRASSPWGTQRCQL
jgi:hypothetical protein